MYLDHISLYFSQISNLIKKIDLLKIKQIIKNLAIIKNKKGRVFFLGVGGSAGNCSHAVNDFRKICEIECYAPTDNVSELTARINDEGWNSSLSEWLKVSNLNSKDAIFVFSVGGGNVKKNVSLNLVQAIKYAKQKKSKIFGIVGKDGGFTKKKGDAVVLVHTINKKFITPFAESLQAVIWHCIVTHPSLQSKKMKW